MQRRQFLRTGLFAAASAVSFPLIRPLRASAQIATFDAANFANMINEIANTTVVTSQQVTQIEEAMQIYNQIKMNGNVNLETIWPVLQKYDSKLLKSLDTSALLKNRGQTVFDIFSKEFPQWKPGQDYRAMYDLWRSGLNDNIQATAQALQATNEDAVKRDETLSAIVAQKPHGTTDAIEKTNQLLNLAVHAISDLRGILSAQTKDQGAYYSTWSRQQDERLHISDEGDLIARAFANANSRY